MNRVFADTSYFAALLNPNDQHHTTALDWLDHPGVPVLTTEYVLLELGNLLSHASSRHKFVHFSRSLAGNQDTEVMEGSSELFRRAADLYASRPDKSWSLTDCASFVVMRDEGISEALTFDKHFEQAGFASALK